MVRGRKISFAEPIEYLYATDEEFFNQIGGFGDEFVRKMLENFRRRTLFVRCLEISRRTVTPESWEGYSRKRLIDLSARPEAFAGIELEIHKRLPTEICEECSVGEVLLSIPGVPKIKSDFAFIQSSPDSDIESIEGFFPLEQWTEAYAHNKWRSFVYAPARFAGPVRDAAVAVLSKMGINVEVAKSNQACHLPDPPAME